MLISVVYSFYNEEKVLPELIERTIKSLESTSHQYEIIFVNDSSTDDSYKLLKEKAEDNKAIKIINMSGNYGQTQCVIAGLNYAQGDAAIYLDADLQDPPELFPKLIEQWQKGSEVVLTKRTRRLGENPLKMLLTKLGYVFWSKAAKVKMNIECGDFVLLDKKVYKKLSEFTEEDPFLRGLVAWLGYKQSIVEYKREARFAGETHFPFWGGNPIETFFIGLTSFSIFPLYITFFIAGLFLVMSLLSLIFFFPESLLFTVITLGFGTLHFCLGIIGIYLARVHFQSRRRKLYNVESLTNL